MLSTSGHIDAPVNPPGNKRASFQVWEDGDNPYDAAESQRRAVTEPGS